MADPDTAHGFVYNDEGYIDIDASPYFDVTPGVDYTVGGYIDRVYYQLAQAIALELGVHNRAHPDYADHPLHPSYVALQTLYRRPHTTRSPHTVDPPLPPRSSSGIPTGIRYLCWTLIVVALSILIRIFCRSLV